MSKAPTPPAGFRFDAFSDVRMGKSIFEMSDEDWLVPDLIGRRQCAHGNPLSDLCRDCDREHREATE